jgi:lethal(2) giant larvae protein
MITRLFSPFQEVRHGFPHKPSAVAFDPDLRLLAIGTKQGAIRM